MSNCCILCYRLEPDSKWEGRKGLIKRFLQLLERYLNESDRDSWDSVSSKVDGKEGSKRLEIGEFIFEQALSSGMIVCGRCGKLMESICALYHQRRCIELELNRMVGRLEMTLKSGQEDTDTMRTVRERAIGLMLDKQFWCESQEMLELLGEFKKLIWKRCSKKISNSFPIVYIARCQPVLTGIAQTNSNICKSTVSPNVANDYDETAGLPEDEQCASASPDFSPVNSPLTTEPLINEDVRESTSLQESNCDLRSTQKRTFQQNEDNPTSINTVAPEPPVKREYQSVVDDAVEKELIVSQEHPPVQSNGNGTNETGLPILVFSGEVAVSTQLKTESEGNQDEVNSPVKLHAEKERINDNEIGGPSSRRLRTVHRCQSCSKTFSSKSTLTEHMQICSVSAANSDMDSSESINSELDAISSDDSSSISSSSSDSEIESDSDCSNLETPKVEAYKQVRQRKSKCTGNEDAKSGTKSSTGSRAKTVKLELNDDDGKRKKSRFFSYRFKCPRCRRLFKRIYEMMQHLKEEHKLNSKASSSDVEEEQEVNLLKVDLLAFPARPVPSTLNPRHKTEHSLYATIKIPDKSFLCPVRKCRAVLYSAEDMECHRKLHGKFPCSVCDYVADFARKLSEHELTHKKSSSSLMECIRCSDTFRYDVKYFQHHINDHLSLQWKEFSCGICNRKFPPSSKSRAADHYRILHNLNGVEPEAVKRCKIGKCRAYFLTSRQLSYHQLHEHNLDEGSTQYKAIKRTQIKCDICGKGFLKRFTLESHRKKLHPDKIRLLKCSYKGCEKEVETEFYLKKHILEFHKVDTKECPQCRKNVPLNRFKRHVLCHEQKKKSAALPPPTFVCETCGKCFKAKYKLQAHMLHHLSPDKWEFECETCGKKCFSKHSLGTHMQVHSKEKPFVCTACGQQYAGRHNLRIHVNSKHGGVMQGIAKKYDLSNFNRKRKIANEDATTATTKPS